MRRKGVVHELIEKDLPRTAVSCFSQDTVVELLRETFGNGPSSSAETGNGNGGGTDGSVDRNANSDRDVDSDLLLRKAAQPRDLHQELRNVLYTFQERLPLPGYEQGMATLCAYLLAFMSESHCFWVLCAIVERIRGISFYFNPLPQEVGSGVFVPLNAKILDFGLWFVVSCSAAPMIA